jgi:hypothetical protein
MNMENQPLAGPLHRGPRSHCEPISLALKVMAHGVLTAKARPQNAIQFVPRRDTDGHTQE